MDQLQNVFDYGEAQVRTMVKDNEVWFVAKDVCEVLEIQNVSEAVIGKYRKGEIGNKIFSGGLDEDERSFIDNVYTLGGEQRMLCVNEYGLYSLIFKSRKPEAKQFKRWITHEVIPSIRSHGAYMTPQTIEKTLNDPDFIIGLASKLKQANEEKQKAIQEKEIFENKLIEQRPKVVFAEAVEVSANSILVKDLATLLKQKGVDIGQNRLFEWLRDNDYLCKKQGGMYNKPTQRSLNMKLFELKPYVRSGSDGEMKTEFTSKVTGKGQIYFINKFLDAQQIKDGVS